MFKNDFQNDEQGYFFNNDKKLSDDYQTPTWFFNVMNKHFEFGADMACDSTNCKVKGSPLFDKGESGLHCDWSKYEGMKYVFPPFSKPYFSKYIQKARYEWEKGQESVVLAPLKTITVEYFQSYKAPLIYVIYPRIRFTFNGQTNQSGDSVCLLVYSNKFSIQDATTPRLEYLNLSRHITTKDELNGNKL